MSAPTLFSGITLPGKPDLENVRRLDLLPIPMLRQMSRLGIAIDREYFHDLTSELRTQMADLRTYIACEIPPERLDQFAAIPDLNDDTDDQDPARSVIRRIVGKENEWSPINVESSVQLGKLIYDILGIGKGKELKRTGSGDRISTGKKQLEILKKEHPVIQLVLDYRERSKLVNTYTSKLPRIAREHPRSQSCPICELPHTAPTFRVHTEFTSTRTDTGRFASKNPNLQNIPARTELGRRVRAGFIASPGTLLVGRDFAQIELRLLAHCAVESALIHIFTHGLDPHVQTAMRAFQKTEAEVTSKQGKLLYRAPCKNVNFGIVYGLSGSGLYDLMAVTYAVGAVPLPDWLTVEWCDQFIAQWFQLYPDVRAYMDTQYYRARRYGLVWDIFGRIRLVPEIQSALEWIQSAGLRQSGNMPIQASGAGLMKLALGQLDERKLDQYGWHCWPLLTIHDEVIFETSEDFADTCLNAMGEEMDSVMVDRRTGKNCCRVPITSDGGVMERWVKA